MNLQMLSDRFLRMRVVTALTFALGTIASLSAYGQTLIFTDSHHPVENAEGHQVILLDKPQLLDELLSVGLPNDPDAAQKSVLERLYSPEGQKILDELKDAHLGVYLAWAWQIQKIPATVVQGQYVVYGETNVLKALATITRYRNLKGELQTLEKEVSKLPSYRLPQRRSSYE
jgi:integrating conjugative element protein (TIGR03757 family)